MNALLLVDLQNDFVVGGALEVRDGEKVVPVVNGLQSCFELIVATQDWHPVNHGSFAANHPGRRVGEVIELGGLSQILWPVHCVQGTSGADFIPGLERARWAAAFQKGTDPQVDSYSGFFDNGRKKATGLEAFLRSRGVTDLFVAGLATDYCVKFTVLDARELGFRVHLIEDGCHGVDLRSGDVERALSEMRAAGAETLKAVEVQKQLTC